MFRREIIKRGNQRISVRTHLKVLCSKRERIRESACMRINLEVLGSIDLITTSIIQGDDTSEYEYKREWSQRSCILVYMFLGIYKTRWQPSQ